MQLDYLLGNWRSTKIHWHGNMFNYYTDADTWRQYNFEQGGQLLITHNYKGSITNSFMPNSWAVHKSEIITLQNGKPDALVKELRADAMILLSVRTGIVMYFKRVPAG